MEIVHQIPDAFTYNRVLKLMSNFQLDSRLAADTVLIDSLKVCEVRLMNDRRWLWVILVPKLANVEEIHTLSPGDQAQITIETSLVATVLKDLTNCTKINTAAIGNIVRQLHIHVIARNENDANWPGPVWGFGERQAYEDSELTKIVRNIQESLAGLPQERNVE